MGCSPLLCGRSEWNSSEYHDPREVGHHPAPTPLDTLRIARHDPFRRKIRCRHHSKAESIKPCATLVVDVERIRHRNLVPARQPRTSFLLNVLGEACKSEEQSLRGRVAEIAGKTHVEGMGRCSECGEYTQVLGVQP